MIRRLCTLLFMASLATVAVVSSIARVSLALSEALLEVWTEVAANPDLILNKDSITPLSSAEKSELKLLREPSYQSLEHKYWKLTVGNCPEAPTTAVVTDEVDGGEPLIYVDANNNRDLTDDGAPRWTLDQASSYRKDLLIKVTFCQDGGRPTLALPYRFLRMFMVADAKKEKPRYAYKAQYVRTGFMEVKGNSHKIVLQATGQREVFSDPKNLMLGIDRNRDGKVDDSTLSAERFYDPTRPFNVAGESYVISRVSPSGDRIAFQISSLKTPPKNYILKGEAAPDFEFATLQGKRMRLSALKGKVVMLDFWATWCRPCVVSLPKLKDLHNQQQPGFEIIGVSLDEGDSSKTASEMVRQFASKNQMTWPISVDGDGFDSSVAKAYNITAIPTNVVVDQRGIIYSVERALTPEQFDVTARAVTELLKK